MSEAGSESAPASRGAVGKVLSLPMTSTELRSPRYAHGQDRSLQVNEALQALPPMYRTVIVLRTQEGMTYREVADHLGITERAVKRHIVKGYARLRDSLAEPS